MYVQQKPINKSRKPGNKNIFEGMDGVKFVQIVNLPSDSFGAVSNPSWV